MYPTQAGPKIQWTMCNTYTQQLAVIKTNSIKVSKVLQGMNRQLRLSQKHTNKGQTLEENIRDKD